MSWNGSLNCIITHIIFSLIVICNTIIKTAGLTGRSMDKLDFPYKLLIFWAVALAFQFSVFISGAFCIVTSVPESTIAEADSRWLPTAAARGSTPGHFILYLCWTKWQWGTICPSTLLSSANSHSILVYIWGWYNGPSRDRHTRWYQSRPALRIRKKTQKC
jgi:hypothetical protein